MATVILENRADTHYIREVLGYAKIDTTQIYTQVGIRRLKEVHDLAHPVGLAPRNHGACKAGNNPGEARQWAGAGSESAEKQDNEK